MTALGKKLIEVSLPLEAINAASARAPLDAAFVVGAPVALAACRAVLFAQLVDDPSSWPEEFPTEEAQNRERERLHEVVAEMVPWEASGDERVMGAPRYEIVRSLARGRGDAPPTPMRCWRISGRTRAAGVRSVLRRRVDPAGGAAAGAARPRLGPQPGGGADLKATCEIPLKFTDRPPVNPDTDPYGMGRKGWPRTSAADGCAAKCDSGSITRSSGPLAQNGFCPAGFDRDPTVSRRACARTGLRSTASASGRLWRHSAAPVIAYLCRESCRIEAGEGGRTAAPRLAKKESSRKAVKHCDHARAMAAHNG